MKTYPPAPDANIGSILEWLRTIAKLRMEDTREIGNPSGRFVRGRLRTDRAAPSANTNVVGGDKEGDVVRTATYQYIVVNDAGTLKWARHAIDVTW